MSSTEKPVKKSGAKENAREKAHRCIIETETGCTVGRAAQLAHGNGDLTYVATKPYENMKRIVTR